MKGITGYGHVAIKVTDVDRTSVVQNNASRWGMRGEEDMGGGLKAFFQLESGFNIDTGAATNNFGQGPGPNGSLFNRESFAGITTGIGTLRAGRITMTRPDKPNDPDQAYRAPATE